jgi:hypothetical protein
LTSHQYGTLVGRYYRRPSCGYYLCSPPLLPSRLLTRFPREQLRGRRMGTENSNERAGINRSSIGPPIVGPPWWQQKEKQMSRDDKDDIDRRGALECMFWAGPKR